MKDAMDQLLETAEEKIQNYKATIVEADAKLKAWEEVRQSIVMDVTPPPLPPPKKQSKQTPEPKAKYVAIPNLTEHLRVTLRNDFYPSEKFTTVELAEKLCPDLKTEQNPAIRKRKLKSIRQAFSRYLKKGCKGGPVVNENATLVQRRVPVPHLPQGFKVVKVKTYTREAN